MRCWHAANGPLKNQARSRKTGANLRPWRSRGGHDSGGPSLMRALAGARPSARVVDGEENGKIGALYAIRARKVGKRVPKPIHKEAAKRFANAGERAGETRDPWICARDAAV